MGYLVRFGDYTFPSSIRPESERGGNDTAPVDRPRAPGAATQIGRRTPTLLQLVGELYAPTAAQLDVKEAALKAALFRGKQNLYFGRDDFYYRDAQMKSVSVSYQEGKTFGVVGFYSITFEAADFPSPFAATSSTMIITGGEGEVPYSGVIDAFPLWTIEVDEPGTGPITLTNLATAEVATLSGSFGGGDVIALARDGYRVLLNDEKNFGIFNGIIPKLIPGVNAIEYTAGGTATVARVSATYHKMFG